MNDGKVERDSTRLRDSQNNFIDPANRNPAYYQGTISAAGVVTGLTDIDGSSHAILDVHIQGTTFPPTIDAVINVQGTNNPAADGATDAETANGWAALEMVSPGGGLVTAIKNPGRYLLRNPPRKVRIWVDEYVSGTAQVDVMAKPVPQHGVHHGITDKDSIFNWEQVPWGTGKVAQPAWLAGNTFDGTTLNQREWIESTANGGSITVGGGQVELNTGAADAFARLRTRTVPHFSGDTSHEATFNIKTGDLGVADNKKRWGIFDEDDGFFIEQYHDGTSGRFRAITRKGGVDTVDPLFPIGVGKPTNAATYQFWRFIYNPNFVLVYQGQNLVHLFIAGTISLEPLYDRYDLPATIEIENENGSAVDSSLFATSCNINRLGIEEVSNFSRLLQRILRDDDELRLDVEPTSADFYLGRALDGTATAATEWDVMRIYLSTTRNPNRIRFRRGVSWDSRTSGW